MLSGTQNNEIAIHANNLGLLAKDFSLVVVREHQSDNFTSNHIPKKKRLVFTDKNRKKYKIFRFRRYEAQKSTSELGGKRYEGRHNKK